MPKYWGWLVGVFQNGCMRIPQLNSATQPPDNSSFKTRILDDMTGYNDLYESPASPAPSLFTWTTFKFFEKFCTKQKNSSTNSPCLQPHQMVNKNSSSPSHSFKIKGTAGMASFMLINLSWYWSDTLLLHHKQEAWRHCWGCSLYSIVFLMAHLRSRLALPLVDRCHGICLVPSLAPGHMPKPAVPASSQHCSSGNSRSNNLWPAGMLTTDHVLVSFRLNSCSGFRACWYQGV